KIACYIGSLETIASCETGHRCEKAKELLDRYKEGTRPDRKLARNWDKECSHKCKSVEPSVHVHHPTFIGGGTVSGIINSETFTSRSSNKDQKKAQDPVDKISAFFTDSIGVKVESELQNSPSVSDDNGSNYMPSDTDESTLASDTDSSKNN
ncbi:19381_t:CDS:2, partial [Gigaspora rosea]